MFTFLPLFLAFASLQQTPADHRERMWRAPTTEEWAQPVLIPFERNWQDARAVSAETGRPILICVNMDGEIASEHYAGVRYRQAEIARLYWPYVCLVASVYRHNPRDYDLVGNRILCPRFESVTCGEHIATEVLLYEKYFDGTRVAPRHIMLELDGTEVYDLFYAPDTSTVFGTIESGIRGRESQPQPHVHLSLADRVAAFAAELKEEWFGDDGEKTRKSLDMLVVSKGNAERSLLEETFQDGNADVRQEILEAVLRNADADQPDLLRLAISGNIINHRRQALDALGQSTSAESVAVVTEALRGNLGSVEKENLLGALDRLGSQLEEARRVAAVHRGMDAKAKVIDPDGLAESLLAREYPAKKDAEALLTLADASLIQAVYGNQAPGPLANFRLQGQRRRLHLEDVIRFAEEAEELGATDWRTSALLGLAFYYQEKETASVAKLLEGVEMLPASATDWKSIASLSLVSKSLQEKLKKDQREGVDWNAIQLAQIRAVGERMLRHPMVWEEWAVDQYDFLISIGAFGPYSFKFLTQALESLPKSWDLHARLRSHLLYREGRNGLAAYYQRWMDSKKTFSELTWFAGFAQIKIAEQCRRDSQTDAAFEAYAQAESLYRLSIEKNSTVRESSATYMAMICSGRARLWMESQQWEKATNALLQSFQWDPQAASLLDGMNLSARMTTITLLARLGELGETELSQPLRAAAPFSTRRPSPDPKRGGR
jgi:hypothetical protein